MTTGTCPKGHVLTPENIYLHKDGWKECRICRKAVKQEYRATSKGKLAQLRSMIQQAQGRITWAKAEIEKLEAGS